MTEWSEDPRPLLSPKLCLQCGGPMEACSTTRREYEQWRAAYDRDTDELVRLRLEHDRLAGVTTDPMVIQRLREHRQMEAGAEFGAAQRRILRQLEADHLAQINAARAAANAAAACPKPIIHHHQP